MFLNETYGRVQVGKHLFDMFPTRNSLKQGDALLLLLFNFAFEITIGRVQINQDGLKLLGTCWLSVCADDVNVLSGRMHTVEKNAEAVVVNR
jgi:hypothetical protein